jgi:uncharacterized ubiquitin-like protein YukD
MVNNIIICIHLETGGDEIDLEISPDVPIEELVKEVVQIFEWSTKARYDVYLRGKTLSPNDTLANLNAWDGTELIFHQHTLVYGPVNPEGGSKSITTSYLAG